ncbi:FGGY-family carbohydrate kinase [Microbacterium sp. zg.Y909]|uniref:FGGY-family carbohydrate kinase n=1 Tax=Microbacterium sp. zg.Y909 TaxID=2969413 RepID=UPI00214BB7CF|nr:FGGY family carbohydrate kinase [Microbacterium sp. zg.Y909]MCR2824260.1 FGGY family carbohydrate kinase [Microbacterium sp. zg.Y909]
MFLGIDVGTFESKGVLVDRDGMVVAAARRRHGIDTPAPGWVEQDPEDAWWADVCAIARDLLRHPGAEKVEAVAVSAIGPCVVATDADLRPLRPAILYGIDTRATKQIERLTAGLGAEEIVRRSGNTLTSQSAGPKIAWLKDEEPDVWRQARWFMTSQSWLVAKLTGEVVIDHATAGYFHPLYDLSAGAWDVSGCEDFVDLARLPRIAWTTERAGAVTAAAARITGIPEGTPVIAGTTDSPAEAVGSGVVADGELMAMYGSSGYFIRVGDRARVREGLWSAPFVFEGTYVLASGTSTAGTATRWLADLLGLASDQDELTFSRLIDLAGESEAGARGVLALPHFAGERTPFQDPTSRGALIGLGLEHTRADVARAVLEGVGHSIAAAILALCSADAPVWRVVAIGGATQNPIIMTTVSTITGLEQQVTDSPGAAYGNAFLAALGVGAVQRPAEVRGWVRERQRVRPDDDARDVLVADHAQFAALYRAVAPLHQERAR